MKNKILDKKLIASKVYEISQLIEGLTIPNVACIFSSIIVDIVNSARSQGVDVSDFVIEWLFIGSSNKSAIVVILSHCLSNRSSDKTFS